MTGRQCKFAMQEHDEECRFFPKCNHLHYDYCKFRMSVQEENLANLEEWQFPAEVLLGRDWGTMSEVNGAGMMTGIVLKKTDLPPKGCALSYRDGNPNGWRGQVMPEWITREFWPREWQDVVKRTWCQQHWAAERAKAGGDASAQPRRGGNGMPPHQRKQDVASAPAPPVAQALNDYRAGNMVVEKANDLGGEVVVKTERMLKKKEDGGNT